MIEKHKLKELEYIVSCFTQHDTSLSDDTRKRENVLFRFLCIYFIRINTKLSSTKIGIMYNELSHAGVLYAVKKINNYYDTDKKVKEFIDSKSEQIKDIFKDVEDIYKKNYLYKEIKETFGESVYSQFVDLVQKEKES